MSFLYWLESIRCPFLDAVMQAFTCFGEELAFLLLALTIFWCVSKEEGYYLLFVGFFGTALNQFLKLLCRIPRPWVRDPSFTIVESARSGAGGYSFPSGHTQNAVGTLGGIARWHKNRALRIVCIVLAALTAFSRMYLGVHTPLDVSVAAVTAVVLIFVIYPIVRSAAEDPKKMAVLLGVMTVVAGWFVTALGGFIIAYVVGLALVYGGTVMLILLTVLAGYMLVHSNFIKKTKSAETTTAVTNENVVEEIATVVSSTINTATRIYDRTLLAVFKENRKVLRDLNRESSELYERMHERKYRMMSTLRMLRESDLDTAQYYVQVVDYLNELTKALTHIVRPAYGHIDNNHEGLTREQTTDLIRVGDEVEAIYRRINAMLTTNDFGDIDLVLSMRDRLFETISDAIKSELRRFNTSGKGSTKASMLYLTILNETRTMVLQLRNLLKAQRHFLETKGVIKSWLYYAK